MRHLVEATGIEPVLAGLPPRVEACARGEVITVINHNPETVKAGDIVLEPYAYRIRQPAENSPRLDGAGSAD